MPSFVSHCYVVQKYLYRVYMMYLVKTPADNPNSVSLALAMASSSESNDSTVMTGPNISSLTTVMSSVQSVMTQGDM